jgi:hypothetical protein
MKTLIVVTALSLLAGCAGMHREHHGRSETDSSGASGMSSGGASGMESGYSERVFHSWVS